MSLFDDRKVNAPLASRLRPKSLEDFVGQEHLLGKGKMLRQLIEKDQISSMIFWGQPGVGKTTLASIIAGQTKAEFINFSAVTSGIKEIKEVNAALLSRCKVFVLKALTEENLIQLLCNALKAPAGFGGQKIHMTKEQLAAIAQVANGDARTALNTLEMAVLNGEIAPDGSITVTNEGMEQCISRKSLLYDKNGEEHYNMISALHKSMRNSDPDAAIYWMQRMLEGGENPLYIARRLIRFASEDIGMADSGALQVAVAAYQACHFNGMPECDVNLAHAVTYLSMAPKSNALYVACEETKKDIRTGRTDPVPLWICNAPTKLMKELDYGKGYEYAHDYENKLTRMQCLPEALKERKYYCPTEQGKEREVKERLEAIREWKMGDEEQDF